MSITKPVSGGGGGAWSIVDDQIVTDVNQVEFTGLEAGATYEIHFSVQANAADEFSAMFDNDTSLDYSYQYINGENGSAVALEDTIDPSFKFERLGSANVVAGKITIGNLSHTQPQTLGARLWSYTSTSAMNMFNFMGVYVGSGTIDNMQLGFRDWIVSGNAARTMTGRVTLLKLG